MGKRRDIPVGSRFGRLEVLSIATDSVRKKRIAEARCSCPGKPIVKVVLGDLLSGHTKSCGCEKAERIASIKLSHGLSATDECRIWYAMHNRCKDSGGKMTKRHGARGIRVCKRWSGADGLASFIADMGKRPSKDHSIDRKDNDLGYFKENCRWATRKEQMRNTSKSVFIEFRGEKKTLAEWAESAGVTRSFLRNRLRSGWEFSEAIAAPSGSVYHARGHRSCL